MRHLSHVIASLVVAAAALPFAAQAQSLSADYGLTRPAFSATPPSVPAAMPAAMPAAVSSTDTDLLPRGPSLPLGKLRVTPAFGTTSGGAGLSIEAGQQWFARLTVGRSLETDQVALGGGYRWREGETVSLQLSRGRGQASLGLAVRYDWPRYFLRFGYDPRQEGTADMLRFSAGMRF